MTSQILHASAVAAAPAGAAVKPASDAIPLLSTAILFVFAAATAVAADLATPLVDASVFVGAALAALMFVFGALHFRSGAKAHEARLAALALPAALCAWAVFNHYEGPAGQPPSGVLAQTLPALERLQARRLPVRADVSSALRLEADLKIGDEAAKTAALAAIPGVASPRAQKYLYETAAGAGDAAQKQRVLAALLARQAGRALAVELTSDDNLTLQSQYLDGASIRFEAGDGEASGLRARLTTNKEVVVLQGALSGPAVTMTGKANLADAHTPLALDATLGPGLTLTGAFRFAHGPAVPFAVQAF
jgi:hypothetical protein